MNVEMDSVTGVPTLSNYFNNLPLNPIFIVIIVIVILSYVLLFSSLGSSASDTSPVESNGNGRVLGIILAAVFLVLLIINGFNYLLNVDIITTIKNLFTNHPEIDINVQTPNLPNNGPDGPVR